MPTAGLFILTLTFFSLYFHSSAMIEPTVIIHWALEEHYWPRTLDLVQHILLPTVCRLMPINRNRLLWVNSPHTWLRFGYVYVSVCVEKHHAHGQNKPAKTVGGRPVRHQIPSFCHGSLHLILKQRDPFSICISSSFYFNFYKTS